MELKDLIRRMDHASLGNLLGDVAILDLLTALSESQKLNREAKANVVLDTFGIEALLDDRQKRKVITLSLNGEERKVLANDLNINPSELEKVTWNKANRSIFYSYF